MNKSILFRTLLLVQVAGILIYTFVVFQTKGGNLFQVFASNILSLTWSGQFNLDFLCYLMLSGLWIMWRNKFSGISIVLGLLAMVLGIVFFAPYLLWCVYWEKGNLVQVLINRQYVEQPSQQ